MTSLEPRRYSHKNAKCANYNHTIMWFIGLTLIITGFFIVYARDTRLGVRTDDR